MPSPLAPQELPRLHGYVDGTLGLKETLKKNLRRLTPQEFERVLHPVFEEDELTLIFVGAVLGGGVGWAQAWWDARSKRLAAETTELEPWPMRVQAGRTSLAALGPFRAKPSHCPTSP